MDDWEMEGPGHRFLLGEGQTPGIGVKRAGRVMKGQRARSPKGPEPHESRKEARVRGGRGRAWGMH